MRPVALDFETTSQDALTAHPIEVGLADCWDGAWFWESFIALPPGETIPPETSAVHHIIDEDIEGAPSWERARSLMYDQLALDESLEGVVLVAHNASYEQGVLAGTPYELLPWVCTFKCALIAFPEAPSHSNEALRYWLKLGSNRGRSAKQGAHSALHDAKVTAGLFNVLYGWFHSQLVAEGEVDKDTHPLDVHTEAAVMGRMIAISKAVAVLPRCPIGTPWRGMPWEEVDGGFLSWAIKQPDMREDVVVAARKELNRRKFGR
jgi:exodeoxyribonuclease X